MMSVVSREAVLSRGASAHGQSFWSAGIRFPQRAQILGVSDWLASDVAESSNNFKFTRISCYPTERAFANEVMKLFAEMDASLRGGQALSISR